MLGYIGDYDKVLLFIDLLFKLIFMFGLFLIKWCSLICNNVW